MSQGHIMCTGITVHIRLTCALPKLGNVMWTLPEIFRTSLPNFLHVACTWHMKSCTPFLWCRTCLLELNKSWHTGHTICTYSTVHIRLACTLSTTGNVMWHFRKTPGHVHLISCRWPVPDTWNFHAPFLCYSYGYPPVLMNWKELAIFYNYAFIILCTPITDRHKHGI